MRYYWLLAALFAALPAAELKIAYVYSEQILKEYKGMQEPLAALNKEKAGFRQRADSLAGLLSKARADLAAQKLLLSDEGRAAKTAEIEELQKRYDDYLREVYGPKGRLEQKTDELMGPVIEKLRETVARIAKDRGYLLVFDASESKLAILYAESGLNITRDVIDELNREYQPVTPSTPAEKRYAVCPLNELNSEASEANAGEQARALIYELIKSQPRTQMVTPAELNSALLTRGISGRTTITEEVVYGVGKDIQADYIFYGTVTKSGKKYTIVLSIADPRLNKTFASETGTASRVEELKQTLGNLVSTLIRRLPQE